MGNAGVCTRRTLIKQARVCDQAMPGLRLACDHLAGLWERHISRETCLKGSLAYQVVQQQGEAEMGGFVHGGRGPRRWQRASPFRQTAVDGYGQLIWMMDGPSVRCVSGTCFREGCTTMDDSDDPLALTHTCGSRWMDDSWSSLEQQLAMSSSSGCRSRGRGFACSHVRVS